MGRRPAWFSPISQIYMILSPTLSTAVLGKYLNFVFVETGTYLGGGVQIALNIGFNEIHSIEKHVPFYEDAKLRFADQGYVHLYQGDTLDVLWGIIEKINEPITFWLDGHEHPNGGCGKVRVPVMEELAIIKNHPIKSHKFLIDDIKLCETTHGNWIGDSWKDVRLDKIIGTLLDINPKYSFFYEDHVNGDRGAILGAKL